MADWYPAGMRVSQEKQEKREKRKNRTGKKSRPKGDPLLLPEKTESIKASESSPKVTERILGLLRSNPTLAYTPQEVSQALGIERRVAAMALVRLTAKQMAERAEAGKYRTGHRS